MDGPSLRPSRGPCRGRFSRQRRVREAIGEARAALQESLSIAAAPHPLLGWVRRRVYSLANSLREWKPGLARPSGRRGPARRLNLAPHVSTIVVILLLGVTLAGHGFDAYTAPQVASAAESGGVRLLIQGREEVAQEQPFAFAIAPMTVVQRRPTLDSPPEEVSNAGVETLRLLDVVTYTVAAGDTLESIARQFEVGAYTIFWENGLSTPWDIAPGMVLTIPPLSGVPHTVRPGQTLDVIADMYGVRSGNIVGYPANGLTYPYELEAGQEIFVPGGVIEIPSYAVEDGERPPPTLVQMPGGEKMRWPTWGSLTAPFGWSRAHGGYHRGIDIANRYRTPIFAAAAGTVVEAGWGSLGWWAEIDHGNGFVSIYGHMAERPLVAAGEEVEKGQQIGYMGSTYGKGGYASGVHLHFAVKHRGVYIDPLPLLER